MIKITVKEAIEQGYTYCTRRFEEFEMIGIEDCDFTHKDGYEIVDKETKPYQIPDDVLSDAINEYLDNQEDVDNSDGELNKLVANIDYTKIIEEINNALSVTKFFQPTDIFLIP